MGILEQIDAATHIHEFEAIAREFDSSPETLKHLDAFLCRLKAIDMNLPQRLGQYCQKLIESGHNSYEEIHKIFSLIDSLSILSRIGLDGAREWLARIAEDIGRSLARDARYEMVREDIFGDILPDWWVGIDDLTQSARSEEVS